MNRLPRRSPNALTALALALALVLSLCEGARAAATITILNADGAGEGFNDPTIVAPVGGNAGTTVGQQRLIVFQAAANIWGALLTSNVPIIVQSSFDPLTCTATSAVLGSAGPQTVHSGFPGAEIPATWYVGALANKLSGVDQAPANDDLRARFNSSIGGATCLSGRNWYYGLDHNEGATGVDLLDVVLHEMGHGLGFLSLYDGTTGALLGGQTDVFTHFLKDQTLGLGWESLSNAQRLTSAVNTGNLIWDGPAVTSQLHGFLNNRAEFLVTAPAGIAGAYQFGEAQFGGALTTAGVTGPLVDADDGAAPGTDACTALVNGAAMSGKIALIDRGTCGFTVKVKNAQVAGAIAAVIVNNAAGTPPTMAGTDATITIPSISISQADGATLRAAMASTTVTVRMGRNPVYLAGADDSGRARLYAPNPLQSGSSVSHFDVSASPNLLMEPSINADLTSSVDLTRYLFEDLGWFPHVTGVPEPTAEAAGLRANVPNPFRSATSIAFNLPEAGEATLSVYDVAGRLVTRLLNGHLAARPHQITWNARDGMGRDVVPGLYFYRLTTGGRSETRRMVLSR